MTVLPLPDLSGQQPPASASGAAQAGDPQADAHELMALCAPRLTFISYRVPEKGDAKWLDHQGSFMAAFAAGPVFRLSGAKDLGTTDDYRTGKMPPVNVGLLDGQLAWRRHDGGHTDGPNCKYFIAWADKFLNRVPADQAMPRTDQNSIAAHARLLEKAATGRIDVYFEGDSITRRWGAADHPELLANWKQNFFGWNAADFGWGGDTTQNILRRLNSLMDRKDNLQFAESEPGCENCPCFRCKKMAERTSSDPVPKR